VLRDGDQCHYADEDAIGPLWKGQRFPLISCISGWAMQNRQTAVVPDVYADARVPHDAYRPTFVKSLVMVPVGNEPTAAIGAYWSKVRTPEPEEVAILETLARSTGTALKNIGLLASLSDSAARAERELSERKHAEATLAAAHQRTLDILESIPDAFYTVDHDWRLIFVNRRAEELWRRRREELIGGRLWGAFPGRSSRITAAGCGCGGRSGTVEPPRERGFGTQLIERASTYELDGSVNLDYAQSGLICEVAFPLE
jgi:PAS domain-containing protein